MSLRQDLRAVAKRAAEEFEAGKPGKAVKRAREFMAEEPRASIAVLDLVVAAANRRKPDEALINAYLAMFDSGIMHLSLGLDQGLGWVEEIIDISFEHVAMFTDDDEIDGPLLMRILNSYIDAGIDPGEEMRDLLDDVMLEDVVDEVEVSPEELSETLESLVSEVDGTTFELLDVLAETSKAMPEQFRAFLSRMIATSENPDMREAAVLFLLDTASEVRRATAKILAETATPARLSSTSLRRMIALRNWLPEDDRPDLDAAIRAARRAGVECAPWPGRTLETLVATNIDGAGAQSVQVVVKEGRRRIIASLLVKYGIGIADAWCQHDQTSGDVRDFMRLIDAETDNHVVSLDYLRRLIPHCLATGQSQGVVPGAGFMDFVEAIGIEEWQPREFPPEDIVAELEPGVAAGRLTPAALESALAESEDWLDRDASNESWFEADAEVSETLAEIEGEPEERAGEIVLASILEPRRAKWAERFLWTALWLREKSDPLAPRDDYFILGRELLGGRPLAEISIMRAIALRTVRAGAFEGDLVDENPLDDDLFD